MVEEPTQLVIPQLVDQASSGSSPLSLLTIVILLVLIAAVLWLLFRRSHSAEPSELAFRRLCRQLGLSRREIDSIRSYATTIGLKTPIGIVMNPQLIDEALGQSSS